MAANHRLQSPNFGALLVLAGAIRVLEILLTAKRKLSHQSGSRLATKNGSNWSAAFSIVCPLFLPTAHLIDPFEGIPFSWVC